MKKRIIFVGQSLKVGGIERALVDQINALDPKIYDVNLLLFYKGGDYLRFVSPTVHVITTNRLLSCMAMTNKEAKQNVFSFVIRTIMYLISKYIGNKRTYSLIFNSMKIYKGYDIAISYFNDAAAKGLYYGCNLFVLKKIEARKKITWLHSDCILMGVGSSDNRFIYQQFDCVVNVSFAMKRKFDAMGIVEGKKSKVVYNRYNNKDILNFAKEYNILQISKNPILITIGRLEKYKSTMELLEIAKRLKETTKFKWYFVGTGCLYDEAGRYIIENGLSEKVILTGQVANPYPYIKNADLFVSGSISETFGLSILEALLLSTPVIAYRYDAINEIVQNGNNGIVVNSFEEMYSQLIELLSDKTKMDKLKMNTKLLINYNQLNQEQFFELIQG